MNDILKFFNEGLVKYFKNFVYDLLLYSKLNIMFNVEDLFFIVGEEIFILFVIFVEEKFSLYGNLMLEI